MAWLDRIPVWILVAVSLTLGLAPFVPEPHVWEKLKMLAAGTLARPIDIFDLVYHAAPWLLLGAEAGADGAEALGRDPNRPLPRLTCVAEAPTLRVRREKPDSGQRWSSIDVSDMARQRPSEPVPSRPAASGFHNHA